MNQLETRWPVRSEEQLLEYYDRSFPAAYRCAARLTGGDRHAAEDLVHDAFVRLIRAVQSGDVSDVGIGWIITTVRRRFIDRSRSSQREERRIRLVASDPVDAPPSNSYGSTLDGLSDRERAALIFRYVDELPVADVANLLGTSVRATESLLQRAKRKARASENAS